MWPSTRAGGFGVVDLVVMISVGHGSWRHCSCRGCLQSRRRRPGEQPVCQYQADRPGLLNYEHQNKTFPPGMICDKGEDPALTDVFRPNWVMLTLPYMETALNRRCDVSKDTDLPSPP